MKKFNLFRKSKKTNRVMNENDYDFISQDSEVTYSDAKVDKPGYYVDLTVNDNILINDLHNKT